jgi:glycosyltransferase involved in cell wall biosynthesis
MQKLCIGRYDGVFCNSDYTRSEIGRRARHTWLVPNPLRPQFFRPLPPEDSPRKNVVINIGIFQPRKRQLDLLRLARTLHENGSRLHFRFIGSLADDAYGRACHEALEHAGAAGYASHAGVLDLPALLDEMDAASGLVHIPLEEAFGLVVAEGIARSLKFFGTSVGGIKDITASVDDACLVEMDDLEDLGRHLLGWERLGCPLSRSGVGTMRERYSPHAVGAKHLEIYRELLSEK